MLLVDGGVDMSEFSTSVLRLLMELRPVVFACFCASTHTHLKTNILCFHSYVPETKGLSLEQIQEHLDEGTFNPIAMDQENTQQAEEPSETTPILVETS